ncbi:transcription regulator protein BACH1-like [Erpetoichthys calabaricus]|uniref:Transcription regulator protein BACH1 n=1 Tax=Erpetoichthys calabaricus TaxID=27687 RepID=A0A8C4SIL6_ERPCA|nr:transcription regulator protein BACH1-like [Erpetoichthys calabaricus]
MALQSLNNSVYTYQSSIHSSNVLNHLNNQRQQGILCDMTVMVEDQFFHAHCSVLAACSDYFHARLIGRDGPVFTMALPKEVTAKGFSSLLDFAYTAKLILTKESILEIQTCADFLGFHNLEKTCFSFLNSKFFQTETDFENNSEKKCPRSKYWKSKTQTVFEESMLLDVNFGLVDDDCSSALGSNVLDKEASLITREINTHTLSTSLSSIYKKIQNHSEENQVTQIEECADKGQSFDGIDKESGRNNFEMNKINYEETKKCTSQDAGNNNVCYPCTNTLSGKPALFNPLQSKTISLQSPEKKKVLEGYSTKNNNTSLFGAKKIENILDIPTTSESIQEGNLNISAGSSREREVSQHLAMEVWNELSTAHEEEGQTLPVQISSEKLTECPWLSININETCKSYSNIHAKETECPFLNDLNNQSYLINSKEQYKECELEGSQLMKSPNISSLNSEDESDFDTEGDNESCTREQTYEIELPFPVENIASVARNEFQQMIKKYCLSQEQLDFIHDIRRRSKNRIAAQRCRKRKLDCIQYLKCEIDRLKNEKKKMLFESNQLKINIEEIKHNLSGLCHKICSEAALKPDQISVLAKYSSPECPLSSLMTEGKDINECDLLVSSIKDFPVDTLVVGFTEESKV